MYCHCMQANWQTLEDEVFSAAESPQTLVSTAHAYIYTNPVVPMNCAPAHQGAWQQCTVTLPQHERLKQASWLAGLW